MKLSPWLVIDGYCATRVFLDTDPSIVKNRVAFIEKTPRVLKDGIWISGRKGSGGPNGDIPENELYGFYPRSRQWCDEQLKEMGYLLT